MMLEYIRTAHVALPEIVIAIAGGLCSANLFRLDPVLAKYPNISWDTKGVLRKSGTTFDSVDITSARSYLRCSSELATFHMSKQTV